MDNSDNCDFSALEQFSYSVNAAEAQFHKLMPTCGIAGLLIGVLVGTLFQPAIPGREAIYTVIFPLTSAYFGLAFGFALPMLLLDLRSLRTLAPVRHSLGAGKKHVFVKSQPVQAVVA